MHRNWPEPGLGLGQWAEVKGGTHVPSPAPPQGPGPHHPQVLNAAAMSCLLCLPLQPQAEQREWWLLVVLPGVGSGESPCMATGKPPRQVGRIRNNPYPEPPGPGPIAVAGKATVQVAQGCPPLSCGGPSPHRL